jgi:hypothetical protein
VTRKSSRYGYRDATIILIAYRHVFRASEVSATCSGIRSSSTPGACLAGLASAPGRIGLQRSLSAALRGRLPLTVPRPLN